MRAALRTLLVARRRTGAARQHLRRRRPRHAAGGRRDRRPTVSGLLVELDPDLAAPRARTARSGAGIEVRTADAGTTASYADACPADVFLACGVFGNITDADIARTVAALPSLLASGGHVIWTRGNVVPHDPTTYDGDPADLVRSLFAEAGFEEVSFVRPDDAGFRVGVHRWPGPGRRSLQPDVRLFDFV